MSAAPDFRVGWCPGALRPMRAGDGLLVRVKPRGNRLTLAQAHGIAALAERCGNGALTLTGRGNIQMRGVSDASLPVVTAGLDGLGLLDASAEGEAVRNVLSSPLAGADPTASLDLRVPVAALEQRLATDPALWRLPAKFAWSVDQSGRIGLGSVAADIRFAARPGADAVTVALDGGAEHAICSADDIVPVALRLADAFLGLSAASGLVPHRMRDLVRVRGAASILSAAGLAVEPACPDRAPEHDPVAIGVTYRGAWSLVGAAPAFGLLDAATLATAASLAGMAGATALRLTPWRSLLVAGLSESAAETFAAGLSGTPLILDPGDPRLAVVACVGAPACHRATTAVPVDAARLAPLMARGDGIGLHVSGCAKGCAHAGPAPVTLIGRAGRYDLVRDGGVGATPLATDLPPEALLTALAPMRQMAS